MRQNIFIVGTRAQLIKVAPVLVACEGASLKTRLLMTGQHEETMQDLIMEFGIKTRQEAAIPASERSTISSLIKWIPSATSGVFRCLKDACTYPGGTNVIVHGDTLSTVIGAVCGKRVGAQVVHLESGLTSRRIFDPFPEELTRRVVFRLTDAALCPSSDSAEYMRAGYRCQVIDTGGNTIIDAVRLVGADPRARDRSSPYIVASLHRFQNLYDGKRFRQLIGILENLAELMTVHFVLHPATSKKLHSSGLYGRLSRSQNIRLTPRMGYGDFLKLAAGAVGVLTDGGSNQEELATLGIPTIVMRKSTERTDGFGRNIIMEEGVQEGVPKFVERGGLEALRCEPTHLAERGPSQRVAAFLGTT